MKNKKFLDECKQSWITDFRPFWDVDQTASFLNISPRTVRDLVYKRDIPYRKVGRCLRFAPAEIELWTRPAD